VVTVSVQPDKAADRLSFLLGVLIFTFGFLKLFEPFRSWFEVQIANSGLPAPFFFVGISAEIGTGLALICSVVARAPLGTRRHALAAAASANLVIIMGVATYVHLHPDVPAAVLPLKIKSPVIPLSVLALAATNLMLQARRRARRQERRT
jgi:hypothetical protein